jgi:LPXTG-motif cell wall-anchored protein
MLGLVTGAEATTGYIVVGIAVIGTTFFLRRARGRSEDY